MSHEHPYRRRHYFVKKEYQTKFILKFCLLVALGAALSTVLRLVFARGTLTTAFDQSRLTIQNTWEAILPAAVTTNLITLALISLACVGVVLFVSHKIAGPLVRFEKDLKEIEGGDLTKVIRLRNKDEMKELAVGLNSMTSSLRTKVADMVREMERIADSAASQGAPQGVIQDLHRLRAKTAESFRI